MCTARISIMQREAKNVRMTSTEAPRLAVIVDRPHACLSCPPTYPAAGAENRDASFFTSNVHIVTSAQVVA